MEKGPKFNIFEEKTFPYEDLNREFREKGKKIWNLFLNEDREETGSSERYQTLLQFLWENGTYEEIQTYLDTLRRQGRGEVAMFMEEELYNKRPDLKKRDKEEFKKDEKEFKKNLESRHKREKRN